MGMDRQTFAGGAIRAGRAGSISLKSALNGREVRKLWTAVGDASGGRGSGDPPRSRRGFGYRVRQARPRPSNTSIRDLLSNDRYTEAVLDYWRQRRWGRLRKKLFVERRGRMGAPIGLRPGAGFL